MRSNPSRILSAADVTRMSHRSRNVNHIVDSLHLPIVHHLDARWPWTFGVRPHRSRQVIDSYLVIALREQRRHERKQRLRQAVLQTVPDLARDEQAGPKEADARDAAALHHLLRRALDAEIRIARAGVRTDRGQQRDVPHAGGGGAARERAGILVVHPPELFERRLPRLAKAQRTERDRASDSELGWRARASRNRRRGRGASG